MAKKNVVIDGVKYAPVEECKETHIGIVLDQSSSMNPVRAETIQAVNDFIRQIKLDGAKGGDTYVSLFTFNHNVNPVFYSWAYDKVQEISEKDYIPNGYTAMYEGVGEMLDYLQKQGKGRKGDIKYLLLTVSDGENNKFGKHQPAMIASTVVELEKTGDWTFSYIGANQDLKVASESLGFVSANAYHNDKIGTRRLGAGMASMGNDYFYSRAGGQSMSTADLATAFANATDSEAVQNKPDLVTSDGG